MKTTIDNERRVRDTLVLVVLLGVVCGAALASSQEGEQVPAGRSASLAADIPGHVQIPIELYNQLVEQARDPQRLPRQAPSAYALGSAQVNVDAVGSEPSGSARVRVELTLEVLDDDWVLIPVLPASTPVEQVTVGGQVVQLVPTPQGLAWATKTPGAYRMSLSYRVDGVRSVAGFSLPVPLPQAASINLTARLPGSGLDVTVIPAAGVRTTTGGEVTQVQATVPTSSGVQIAWRTPSRERPVMSRAHYQGRLQDQAVLWSGDLDVELFSDETVTLPLLPRGVTLDRLQVDGEDAPILLEGESFATLLRGRGHHTVRIGFQVPVTRVDGPPRVEVHVPPVPVSRFDLTLPGDKEITVTPASNVNLRAQGNTTIATVFSPMTSRLSFAWAEAIPEDVRAEVRANASIYHRVHTEEGVLDVVAQVLYELTRGTANRLSLSVPGDVQVNRISAPSGAVADWRIAPPSADGSREVTLFLDRDVQERLLFEVHYDRSLSGDDLSAISLPLLSPPAGYRHRGMVALLQSKDLTLNPVDDGGATRVGENQLPDFVREALEMTVAHTFKYVETPPQLVVEATEPERQQGRFDVQVDTLISLGEVTLNGSASVEINLKSGGILELVLEAPSGINVLNLTGPSIRTFQVNSGADPQTDPQTIDVEFTQEMEGQFRLELAYERILGDGGAEDPGLVVPTVAVRGAEVEQGRIAIEALSAAEVRPAEDAQLTALDIGELPRQLVLRTTNPILLAYKYVQTDPAPRLVLEVTRHALLDVQEAAIDRAEYRTLFTRDGLAVTIARFLVRNSRKQFLRVKLPEDAEVWSAFVNGRPEQPAAAEDTAEDAVERGQKSVLLKIVNSTDGFPVQLVYATSGHRIRGLGSVRASLPQPDILVTESIWDVYLPAGMSYREPRSNMDLVSSGGEQATQQLQAEMAELNDQLRAQAVRPLDIRVPTAGVHYALSKLYANQSDQESWLAVRYASARGARWGNLISVLGALLLCGSVVLHLRPRPGQWPRLPAALAGVGGLLLLVTVGVYGASVTPPLLVLLVAALVAGAIYGRRHLARFRLETP